MALPVAIPESYRLAAIAAIMIRDGMGEAAAIHSAIRLVNKVSDVLMDIEADALARSPAQNTSLQGAIERLGVKGRAVREYVFARLGEDAPAFWQRAVDGERCFTKEIMSSLEAEQRAVRAARLARAAAARRETHEKLKALKAKIVAENQRETALRAPKLRRRGARTGSECAKKKAGRSTAKV